jgi:hypothetical protein
VEVEMGEYAIDAQIKQDNAAELGHIINQITLTGTDKLLLSEFLERDDKETSTAYNLKLSKFKEHLETIPNSGEFVKALKLLPSRYDSQWQRHYPIEMTPNTHYIHAEYIRIPPKSMRSFKDLDPFYGKDMPRIFYRATSVLGHIDHKVERLTKIYSIIKPFGYDFPDTIESDGMIFEMIDLYNPQYVCLTKRDSEYKGLPKPIMIDGKPVQPMSNAEYAAKYKAYVRNIVAQLE